MPGSLSGDSATISGPLAVTGETSFSADATFSSNGAIKLPAGTTAQQPGTPINGMLRYNTEDTRFEGYANDAWGSMVVVVVLHQLHLQNFTSLLEFKRIIKWLQVN